MGSFTVNIRNDNLVGHVNFEIFGSDGVPYVYGGDTTKNVNRIDGTDYRNIVTSASSPFSDITGNDGVIADEEHKIYAADRSRKNNFTPYTRQLDDHNADILIGKLNGRIDDYYDYGLVQKNCVSLAEEVYQLAYGESQHVSNIYNGVHANGAATLTHLRGFDHSVDGLLKLKQANTLAVSQLRSAQNQISINSENYARAVETGNSSTQLALENQMEGLARKVEVAYERIPELDPTKIYYRDRPYVAEGLTQVQTPSGEIVWQKLDHATSSSETVNPTGFTLGQLQAGEFGGGAPTPSVAPASNEVASSAVQYLWKRSSVGSLENAQETSTFVQQTQRNSGLGIGSLDAAASHAQSLAYVSAKQEVAKEEARQRAAAAAEAARRAAERERQLQSQTNTGSSGGSSNSDDDNSYYWSNSTPSSSSNSGYLEAAYGSSKSTKSSYKSTVASQQSSSYSSTYTPNKTKTVTTSGGSTYSGNWSGGIEPSKNTGAGYTSPSNEAVGGGKPVVLDLDGDGVELNYGLGATFDWDDDGFLESTGWVSGDDGLLIIDADGDGTVSEAKELALSEWTADETDTDFEALATAFDSNDDGLFDAEDERFDEFRVWQDKNSDAVVDEGELQTLDEAGIASINLAAYQETRDGDGNGIEIGANTFFGSSTFTKTDGTTGAVGDVAFEYLTTGYRIEETASGGYRVEFENGDADLNYLNLADSESTDAVIDAETDLGVAGDARDNRLDASAAEHSVTLEGKGGGDHLIGGSNNDILLGGEGDDQLEGGAGSDLMVGGEGLDSFDGGEGHDTLIAEAAEVAASLVKGGEGYDTLIIDSDGPVQIDLGATEVETFYATDADDQITGSDADEVVYAGGGADSVSLGGGNDVLFADADDTDIQGGDGFDSLIFTDDEDHQIDDLGATGFENVSGGAGADVFTADDTVESALSLSGLGGDDALTGGAGDDQLLGGDGDDSLIGGKGDDLLVGGAGDDLLVGGEGSDIYLHATGDGDDRIAHSAGSDSIILSDVTVDRLAFRRDGDALVLQVAGFAAVDIDEDGEDDLSAVPDSSVRLDDWFVEDNREERINALMLAGTALALTELGNFSVASAAEGEILEGSESAEVARDATGDWHAGGVNDFLTGGEGADTLVGHVGDDILQAHDGDDELDGGDGNDYLLAGLGSDTLSGGAGDDILDAGAGDFVDILDGGDGDDQLFGGDGSDILRGGDGDDVMVGGAGDDLLEGGAGDDRYFLAKGSGNDEIFDNGGTETVTEKYLYDETEQYNYYTRRRVSGGKSPRYVNDLRTGTRTTTVEGERDIELRRDGGIDTLAFGAGINIHDLFLEVVGDDLIIALRERSEGTDENPKGEAVQLEDLADSVTVTMWADQYHRLEQFEFSDGNLLDFSGITSAKSGYDGDDELKGSKKGDFLSGGAGNDTLKGGGGTDIISGGAGDDIIKGGGDVVQTITADMGRSTGDVEADDLDFVTERDGADGRDFIFAGDGDDKAWGGEGDDYLLGEAGNDELTGGHGDDTLSGGVGDDLLVGGLGNDLLLGGQGNDRLEGGHGDDTYFYFRGSGHDTIHDHATAEVTRQVQTGTQSYAVSVRRKSGKRWRTVTEYRTRAVWETQTGSEQIDGGADTLQFGYSIDLDSLFVELQGDDLVIGLREATANEDGSFTEVTLDAVDDTVTIEDWTNEMNQVETWIFGDGEQFLADGVLNFQSGYEGDDAFTGTDERDFLSGGLGDDTLDGGKGDDLLIAGLGDDTLSGGQGDDDLFAGAGDDALDGGAGDDILHGSFGDDTIVGGAGDDKITGGQGDDTLEGGAGDDIYFFNRGDGHDTIRDFAADTETFYTDSNGNQASVGHTNYMNNYYDAYWAGWYRSYYTRDTRDVENDGGNDTLQFGDYITFSDLIVRMDGENLSVDVRPFIAGSEITDSVTVENWTAETHRLELFTFANGFVLDTADIVRAVSGTEGDDVLESGEAGASSYAETYVKQFETSSYWRARLIREGHVTEDGKLIGNEGTWLQGGEGSDTLFGSNSADILDGGHGDDALSGFKGDDVYRFGTSNGQDTIFDTAGSDVLLFDPDLQLEDLIITRDGNDMVFGIRAETGINKVDDVEHSVRITDWTDRNKRVELLRFFDGHEFDFGNIVNAQTGDQDATFAGDPSYEITRVHRSEIKASQSSKYSIGDAEKLIDGIVDRYNWNHTQRTAHEWVELDLGSDFDLTNVSLFNREESAGTNLNGAQLVILDVRRNEIARLDPIEGAQNSSVHRYNWDGLEGARYVRVEQESKYLHLTEIKAHGVQSEEQRNVVNVLDAFSYLTDASSSSVSGYTGAGRVIDGDTSNKSAFHSRREANPWVEIELGHGFNLSHLELYNHHSSGIRLNGAVITVFDAAGEVLKTFDPIEGAYDRSMHRFEMSDVTGAAKLRIEDQNDYLHFTELKALALETDLPTDLRPMVNVIDAYAPYVSASDSSRQSGGSASAVVDGAVDAASFSHTGRAANEFVEIDLGGSFDLKRVELVNHVSAGYRLNGADLVALDVHGNELKRIDNLSGAYDGSLHAFDLSDVSGVAMLRVEHQHQYLVLSEVRAFSYEDELPTDLRPMVNIFDHYEGLAEASASSTYNSSASYQARNVIDGKVDGYRFWSSYEYAPELTIDFGHSFDLARLEVYNGTGGARLNGAILSVLDLNGVVLKEFSPIEGAYSRSVHRFDLSDVEGAASVKLRDPSGRYMDIFEIKAFAFEDALPTDLSRMVNVVDHFAGLASATSSSEYGNRNIYDAMFAVDQSADNDRYSLTRAEHNPWMEVDLGASFNASHLELHLGPWNAHYLNNSKIIVLDETGGELKRFEGVSGATNRGVLRFDLSDVSGVSKLRIEDSYGYISMSEIKVFAEEAGLPDAQRRTVDLVDFAPGLVEVEGSSHQYTTSYRDEQVLDGKYNTSFYSRREANPTLDLNLASGVELSKVQIHNQHWWGYRLNGAELVALDAEGSEIARFGKISGATDASMHEYDFSGVTGIATLRLEHHNQHLAVGEIRLFAFEDSVSDALEAVNDLTNADADEQLTVEASATNDGPAESEVDSGISVNVIDLYRDEVSVSSSSSIYSRSDEDIIDGEASRTSYNHTNRAGDQWIELDLGEGYDLSHVEIFNRVDNYGTRLNGAIVSVLDADGEVLATFDAISGASNGSLHTIDLSGVDGEVTTIRLSHNNQYLHVSEIRAFATLDLAADAILGANDILTGSNEGDWLDGGLGHDVIRGENGEDMILGREGADRLFGGSHNDIISGGEGDDEIHGDHGNDRITGGIGDDTIFGGSGDDTILGGEGIDSIEGGSGNDTIIGDLGDDEITLSSGNDVYLFARGDGNDIVEGSASGYDVFSFESGLTKDDIWFEKEGYDLRVSLLGDDDSVVFDNWFGGSGGRASVSLFVAEGYKLDKAKINNLVDAMAAFEPNDGTTAYGVKSSELPDAVRLAVDSSWARL